MAAEFLGVPHHVRLLDKILSATADANSSLDEPYRGACFCYDALRFVRESGVRYIFDGLGLDEFFGGYGFRYERVMTSPEKHSKHGQWNTEDRSYDRKVQEMTKSTLDRSSRIARYHTTTSVLTAPRRNVK